MVIKVKMGLWNYFSDLCLCLGGVLLLISPFPKIPARNNFPVARSAVSTGRYCFSGLQVPGTFALRDLGALQIQWDE